MTTSDQLTTAVGGHVDVGRVGIWTRQLDGVSGAAAQEAVCELEALGYRSVWIPEAQRREVVSHAALLLSASTSIVVATGIARVHARSPQATALAQRLFDERFPGRFLFGLGVSHPVIVERLMGQIYGPPIATMTSYLDALDATNRAAGAPEASTRLLAALGPKMIALAGERANGIHSYLVPVEHTAWARDVMGPEAFIAPAVKVVFGSDHDRTAAIAGGSLAPTTRMPAYRTNLARFGFTDDDMGKQPSDRLIDALVCCGGVEAITTHIRRHLDAGANHVCVEVLTGDDTTVPMDAWRELAPALTEMR